MRISKALLQRLAASSSGIQCKIFFKTELPHLSMTASKHVVRYFEVLSIPSLGLCLSTKLWILWSGLLMYTKIWILSFGYISSEKALEFLMEHKAIRIHL